MSPLSIGVAITAAIALVAGVTKEGVDVLSLAADPTLLSIGAARAQETSASDIYLDGAVSEVATRRTECAFHIGDGRRWTAEYGIERKDELLRAAVVKSF